MKTKHSVGILDFRHKLDHITPGRIQLFHEKVTDLDNAIFFLILTRRREIEFLSGGSKLNEFKVI